MFTVHLFNDAENEAFLSEDFSSIEEAEAFITCKKETWPDDAPFLHVRKSWESKS